MKHTLARWLSWAGLAVTALTAAPLRVIAQRNLNDLQIKPPVGDLIANINRLLNTVFLIAGITAFLYAIYGGFLYLTAGGEPANADKGRKALTNAIIGVIIISLSFVIVKYAVGVVK